MGSNDHYPEEAPVHRVSVDGFWIDRMPVTNRLFKAIRQGDRLRHHSADRGGLDGEEFAWGNALTPDGKHMAHLAGQFSNRESRPGQRAHFTG